MTGAMGRFEPASVGCRALHWLFACGLLLLVGGAPLVGNASAVLDAYVEKALRDWHTPGLTMAVVQDDVVVLTKGYGVRKRGEAARVDDQTLFAIGSTSKAFAAASVVLLVSDGALQWEDRVKAYLPWLELYDPWVTNELNVRDLLIHHVGTSYVDENRLRSVARNARDLLERSRFLKPVAPFRAEFVYSNNMVTAAGLVVAEVSGMPWVEFARQRLWAPLGMTSTGADVASARSNPNAASPHIGAISIDPEPQAWSYPDAVAVPSGGVNSNARDMAQWLRFQLAEGAFAGRQLIRREVFRQMHAAQTVIRYPERDVSQFPGRVQSLMEGKNFWAYGMGWYITEYRGRKMVWHSGTIDGFRAGVGLLPEEKLAVYVGVNRTPSILPFAMMLRVFDEYLDGPKRDWSTIFREEMSESSQ